MTAAEPKEPYVYQPEPSWRDRPFAIGGPLPPEHDHVRTLRFSTEEMAQAYIDGLGLEPVSAEEHELAVSTARLNNTPDPSVSLQLETAKVKRTAIGRRRLSLQGFMFGLGFFGQPERKPRRQTLDIDHSGVPLRAKHPGNTGKRRRRRNRARQTGGA